MKIFSIFFGVRMTALEAQFSYKQTPTPFMHTNLVNLMIRDEWDNINVAHKTLSSLKECEKDTLYVIRNEGTCESSANYINNVDVSLATSFCTKLNETPIISLEKAAITIARLNNPSEFIHLTALKVSEAVKLEIASSKSRIKELQERLF